MTDIVLLSVMKYLKDNKYEQSWIALESQSETKLFTYPKQIEFFRKIILKGDFDQSIEYMATLQSNLEQRQYKKSCLSIYKQKLYELINIPNQKSLKNLFEKQIVNFCSQEQFQHLFSLLTCRRTQQIVGLSDWTVVKGRLRLFELLLPVIQSVLYHNKSTNYLTQTQPEINLDEAIAIYVHNKNNPKVTESLGVGSRLINDLRQSTTDANKKSVIKSQMQISKSVNQKQIQLQLSESSYQQSRVGFDKKSGVYGNNLSNMQENQSQKFTKSNQRSSLIRQRQSNPIKNEYSGSKLYQEQQIKQISQEEQKSDTIGSNQVIDRSGRSAQISGRSAQLSSRSVEVKIRPEQKLKNISSKYADLQQKSNTYNRSHSEEEMMQSSSRQNIQYLEQTNSVVYNNDHDRDQQNFTFSHQNFATEVEKPKKILKLSTISDNKAIRTCQFSTSGNYFAVGTNSSILKIFDVEQLFAQNNYRQVFPVYEIPNLHSKSIFCLDWSKDESSMVTCSNDLTIKLTQFSQGLESHEVSVIGRHESCIRMVKFDQEQNKIYSCGDDSLVKIWDMGKVKRCYNLKGHSAGISAFKVCPNSNELFSVSKDSTIKRWDLRTLQSIATSKQQQSQMTYIANNTQRIVASNRNGNVLFFDRELNLQYEVKIHEQQIRSIEAKKNSDMFITASFDGHVGMFSQKNIHSPDYFQHNQNSEDKVVFATFLDHPQFTGFASTSTLGLCHIYSYS